MPDLVTEEKPPFDPTAPFEEKPAFDPTKPFEPAATEKPAFDPSQPFQAVKPTAATGPAPDPGITEAMAISDKYSQMPEVKVQKAKDALTAAAQAKAGQQLFDANKTQMNLSGASGATQIEFSPATSPESFSPGPAVGDAVPGKTPVDFETGLTGDEKRDVIRSLPKDIAEAYIDDSKKPIATEGVMANLGHALADMGKVIVSHPQHAAAYLHFGATAPEGFTEAETARLAQREGRIKELESSMKLSRRLGLSQDGQSNRLTELNDLKGQNDVEIARREQFREHLDDLTKTIQGIDLDLHIDPQLRNDTTTRIAHVIGGLAEVAPTIAAGAPGMAVLILQNAISNRARALEATGGDEDAANNEVIKGVGKDVAFMGIAHGANSGLLKALDSAATVTPVKNFITRLTGATAANVGVGQALAGLDEAMNAEPGVNKYEAFLKRFNELSGEEAANAFAFAALGTHGVDTVLKAARGPETAAPTLMERYNAAKVAYNIRATLARGQAREVAARIEKDSPLTAKALTETAPPAPAEPGTARAEVNEALAPKESTFERIAKAQKMPAGPEKDAAIKSLAAELVNEQNTAREARLKLDLTRDETINPTGPITAETKIHPGDLVTADEVSRQLGLRLDGLAVEGDPNSGVNITNKQTGDTYTMAPGETVADLQRRITTKATDRENAAKPVEQRITEAADAYNAERGRGPVKPTTAEPHPDAAAIADAHDLMVHNPNDPKVKASYDAFIKELKEQFKLVTEKLGIKMTATDEDPYKFTTGDAPAEQALRDAIAAGELKVFRGGNDLLPGHPLSAIDPETGENYNTMFRFVHDVLGHTAGGHDFGERGEMRAWETHSQMFSKEARPAMTAETLGQVSWYFNNKGVRERGEAPGAFPEQKAGLLPGFEHLGNKPAIVNIGLKQGEGESATFLTPEEAVTALERIGVKVTEKSVHTSSTEPTLVASLDRALTPDEAHALSVYLKQESIAQHSEGEGDLHGPSAERWKPFKGSEFILHDGSRMAIDTAAQPDTIGAGEKSATEQRSDDQSRPDKIGPYQLREAGDLGPIFGTSGDSTVTNLTDVLRHISATTESNLVKAFAEKLASLGLDNRVAFAGPDVLTTGPAGYSISERTVLFDSTRVYDRDPAHEIALQEALHAATVDLYRNPDTARKVAFKNEIDRLFKLVRDHADSVHHGYALSSPEEFIGNVFASEETGPGGENFRDFLDRVRDDRSGKSVITRLRQALFQFLGISKGSALESTANAIFDLKPGDMVTSTSEGDLLNAAKNTKTVVEHAKELASSNEELFNTEEEFFGDYWKTALELTGKQLDPKDPASLQKAVEMGVRDIVPFLRDNPQFADYYDKDYATARVVLEDFLQRPITEDENAFFQLSSGLASAKTPLKGNVRDAVYSVLEFIEKGHFNDFKVGISPKGKYMVKKGPFLFSSTTGATKVRSIQAMFKIAEQQGGMAKAVAWMKEPVTMEELHKLKQSLGYGRVAKVGQIKSVVMTATGQDVMIPRFMMFGQKVGAYTLNTVGDHRFNTVDIWESRFVRNYFKGLYDKNYGLPIGADENNLFLNFSKEFKKEMEKVTGREWNNASLQALRWYFMLDAAKQSGYSRSLTDETVSQYTKTHTDALRRSLKPDSNRGPQGNEEGASQGAVGEAGTVEPTERVAGDIQFSKGKSEEEKSDTSYTVSDTGKKLVKGMAEQMELDFSKTPAAERTEHDYAVIGADAYLDGATTFNKWRETMLSRIGEDQFFHVRKAWDDTHTLLESYTDAQVAKENITVKRQIEEATGLRETKDIVRDQLKNSISRAEALGIYLKGQEKGGAAGRAAGTKDTKAELQVADRWMSGDQEKIRTTLTDFVNKVLPPAERGRFIGAIGRALRRPDIVKGDPATMYKNAHKVLQAIEARADEVYSDSVRNDIAGLHESILSSSGVSVEAKNMLRKRFEGLTVKHPTEAAGQQASNAEQWAKFSGEKIPTEMQNRLDALTKTPLKNLAVEELEALRDDMKLIQMFGRDQWKSFNEAREHEQRLREVDLAAEKVKPNDAWETMARDVSVGTWQKIKDRLWNTASKTGNWIGLHEKARMFIPHLFDTMDGKTDGWLTRNILKPFYTASRNHNSEVNPIKETANQIAKDAGLQGDDYVKIGVFAHLAQGGERTELIKFSHDENLEALVSDVEKNGLSEGQKKLYDYMRKTLDSQTGAMQSFFANHYNKELTFYDNYFPRAIDSRKAATWRADRDKWVNPVTMEEIDINNVADVVRHVAEIQAGMRTRSAQKGFSKERIEGAEIPLNLNAMEVFLRHMDDWLYVKNYQPHLNMVGKMANTNLFAGKYGNVGKGLVLDYIDALARRGQYSKVAYERALDGFKNRAMVGLLGYRFSQFKHLANYPMGMAQAGGVHWWSRGLQAKWTNEGAAFIKEHAPEILHGQAGDISIQEASADKGTPLGKIVKHSFVIDRVLDNNNRSATFLGKYFEQLAEKGHDWSNWDKIPVDQEALNEARLAYVRSVGSVELVDRPLIVTKGTSLGSKSVGAAFMAYQSPKMVRWGTLRTSLRNEIFQNPMKGAQNITALMASSMIEASVKWGSRLGYTAGASALLGLMGYKVKHKDDEESFTHEATQEAIADFASTMPGGGVVTKIEAGIKYPHARKDIFSRTDIPPIDMAVAAMQSAGDYVYDPLNVKKGMKLAESVLQVTGLPLASVTAITREAIKAEKEDDSTSGPTENVAR